MKNKNWLVLSVSVGIIFLVSFILIFQLPATIARGNQAQKAIQMLDEMRRPFLEIEAVRIQLVKTSSPDLAEPDLLKAIDLAKNDLVRYQQASKYNPTVASKVDGLRRVFDEWITKELHLVFDYKNVFHSQIKKLATKDHIIKDFGIAQNGFLQTMSKLGEGEIPIHKDMDSGHQAYSMMLTSLAIFFLYLIGLMFLQQRLKTHALSLASSELETRVVDRTRELNHKTTFLRMLQSVTAKANEATSINDVMEYALHQICSYTDWPVGHVYVQDKSNKQIMIPTKIWHLDDPEKIREFKRVTERTQFESGVGLPGRVVATKKPSWINDVTKDENFPRAELINNIGVKSAFAFPVIYKLEVVAVLEFFSYEVQQEPAASQIDIVTHIGSQLGHMIERLQTEKILRNSEEEWRLTFDSSSEFVSLHDKDQKFLRANKALTDFLGKQQDEIIGEYCYDVFHCSKQQRQSCLSSVIHEDKSSKMLAETKNGVPLSVSISPIKSDKGAISGYVHVARDITESREFEKRLEHLAHYDHLTGLPNRTLFIDRTEQIIARAPWNDRIMAILYLDLDRFKILNDTFGHDMGDLLLREVAARLKSLVRDGDTVTRLGGDEFAISLVDIAEKDDVALIASKINKILSEAFFLNEKEVFISASIGISLFPNDSENTDSLLKHADTAMYAAKGKGKNTFLFYHPDINKHTSRQIDMEDGLRHALEHNEFELHYQPRVDLKTGLIVGMEALLRWQSKEFGLVPPDMFIPFLEETGLIVPVGEWVIQTACRQNRLWQDDGFPELRVSVNVSARQFIQDSLVEKVCLALSENELKPQHLELEITESVLLEHMDETLASLNELDKLGIHLSLDDFGTGYASLSYLKRYPIHVLKIDKSFINDVTSNANDAALTKAIISIAKNLNLSVTAEGVETNEQLDFLISNECDQIQGYLYSKPLTVENFTKLLEEKHQLDLANGEVRKSGTG